MLELPCGDRRASETLTIDELSDAGSWSPAGSARSVCITGTATEWSVFVDAGAADIKAESGNSEQRGLDAVAIVCRDGGHAVAAVQVAGRVRVHLGRNDSGGWTLDHLACAIQSPQGPAEIHIDSGVSVGNFVGEATFTHMTGSLHCWPAAPGARWMRERYGCAPDIYRAEERCAQPGQILGITNCSGGIVDGADITRLHAMHLARASQDLTVFSPDVESLYNMACAYDRLSWRHRHPDAPAHAPSQKAQWFRALDTALQRSVVPASTRAAVRWCYALLEHQTLKDRRQRQVESIPRWLGRFLFGRSAAETMGRWLLRAVGYVQRPSRPAFWWVVTAAGVSAWSWAADRCDPTTAGCDPDPGGMARFVDVMLSPMGVLRLASSDATVPPDGFVALAYLVMGVAFVFFVVALRQFFRTPLDGGSERQR